MIANPYFTIDTVAPAPRPRVSRTDWLKTYNTRIKANYDAAQTTPDLERWWANADNLGPNASVSQDRRFKLAQRARYECRNNTYLSALIQLSQLYVINKGPKLKLEMADVDAARFIVSEFHAWMRAIKLPAKLRTMLASKRIAGAAFAEKITNDRLRTPVQLDLRLLEIEHIQMPLGEEYMNPLRQGGILHDASGNAVSYFRLREHPGSLQHFGSMLEGDELPAERVIHWFREDRPDQKNGVCEVAAALPVAADMRRYTKAVISHEETVAHHAGVIYSESSGYSEDPYDPDELPGNERIDIERRALLTLPRGWKMGQFSSTQNAADFKDFRTALLEEISRCILSPLNMLSGNSRDANFASAQMDNLVWDLVCSVEQQDCECQVLDDVFYSWLDEALMIPGYLPLVGTQSIVPSYRWPATQPVDPVKREKADTMRWQLGLLSDEEYFDSRSIDPEEHYNSLMRQTERRREIDQSFPQPGNVAEQDVSSSEEPPEDSDSLSGVTP